ncbi:uncharacterized protein LOC111388277 [Olea europaea var. sylvestris]|uniref:uncharacterized protein LOC111388277 n=1 Tax=Olea europaea var. sylvestris TaxID=158386 RepID=UPI000C1D4D54|nr:uncharacterized protein LOC111388277 [Olea europaea var. sylvestris]
MDLFKLIATTHSMFSSERVVPPKAAGIYELDIIASTNAQIAALIKQVELLPPNSVKGIRSFLGHAGFYRMFIKDFSKITKPQCNLLEKYVSFHFSDECLNAFNTLKEKLTSAPVIIAPD